MDLSFIDWTAALNALVGAGIFGTGSFAYKAINFAIKNRKTIEALAGIIKGYIHNAENEIGAGKGNEKHIAVMEKIEKEFKPSWLKKLRKQFGGISNAVKDIFSITNLANKPNIDTVPPDVTVSN